MRKLALIFLATLPLFGQDVHKASDPDAFLARIHAALGENDTALDYLERVYADRSESVVWLKVDPSFDPLRKDPRFIALVKRVGTT